MTSRKSLRRIPGQTVSCGWCGTAIALRTTGRIPTWCSATCRHLAWEQRRAVASERSPVTVVNRVIEVEVEKRVPVVQRIEVPLAPRRDACPSVLTQLAQQLDTGRIYDRDLPDLMASLEEVLVALGRRRRHPTRRH